MNSEISAVKNQIVLSAELKSKAVFQNGSVVSGKVLSFSGGKNYTVEVLGKTMSVSSEIPLNEGSVFRAVVEVKHGTVFLRIQNDAGLEKIGAEQFSKENSRVAQFLQKNGLPNIPQSVQLVQFALASGIKFKPHVFNRALSAGIKDKSRKIEIDKSKTALVAHEKGILINPLVVEKIAERQPGGEKNGQNGTETSESAELRKITEDDVRHYAEELSDAVQTNACGELTLFNSLMPKSSRAKNWIFLPFEWSFKNYAGVFRIQISEDRKSVQKIVINLGNGFKNHRCVLYFKGNAVSSVKIETDFHYEAQVTDFLLEEFVQKLKERGISFSKENVSFSECALDSDFPGDEEMISLFDGEF